VRERPKNESVIETFKAAVRIGERSDDEHKLTFLWGRIVLHSPEARAANLGRLQPSMSEIFRDATAVRLGLAGRNERDADAVAAALGGIVVHVYTQWISQGGNESLARALEQAFDACAIEGNRCATAPLAAF
jgi:hypothetical protein